MPTCASRGPRSSGHTQLEKDRGFDGKGTPESREFIRQQLGRGAQMLLNMWYTAWVDSAGDPVAIHGDNRELPNQ